MIERGEFPAKYVVGRVLELGCGSTPMAKWISNEYTGVDPDVQFVRETLGKQNWVTFVEHNDPLAFVLSRPSGTYDTIVLSGLLHRADDPQRLVDVAVARAKERVIVVDPLGSMSAPDFVELFDGLAVCQIFQAGPGEEKHWLVVKADAWLPITIFAHPKPWKGLDAIQQINALESWRRLKPTPEILLLGDNQGTKNMAEKFGIRHLPEKELGPYRLPLVKNFFYDGQEHAQHEHVMYVNSDIILGQKIVEAIWQTSQVAEQYLIVGQRFDVHVNEALRFSGDWWRELSWRASSRGRLHASSGVDYFAFARGLYKEIPDFVIARCAWDNWLVWSALNQGVPVVDATKFVLAVHQEHNRGNRGSAGWQDGYRHNVIQSADNLRTISTATWILDGLGLRPKSDGACIVRIN